MQSPWTSSSCSAGKSCISAGDEIYLCADVTDIADGATATIKIVEKDADGTDDPVTTLSAVVSGDKIKCQWQVKYTTDDDDADSQKELAEKGYTLPEYAFVVECGGATSGESGVLEVRGGLRVVLKNQETHEILGNKRISLWREDEKILETRTDSEGYFEVIGIGIGEVTVTGEEE